MLKMSHYQTRIAFSFFVKGFPNLFRKPIDFGVDAGHPRPTIVGS